MSTSQSGSFLDLFESLFTAGDPTAQEKVAEAANVRLIKNLFLAIDQGDWITVETMLAPTVELKIVGAPELPFTRSAHGREATLAAIQHNFGIVHNRKPHMLAVIAQGDTVVVFLHEEGEIRENNQPYRVAGVQRFVISNQEILLGEELIVSH
ncbi:MAG: nuclear transport factor 2 family protein [Blastocatellia bacterium]|nr:nuclear transport factor 2 family protein [Blastocatellia bacterium]